LLNFDREKADKLYRGIENLQRNRRLKMITNKEKFIRCIKQIIKKYPSHCASGYRELSELRRDHAFINRVLFLADKRYDLNTVARTCDQNAWFEALDEYFYGTHKEKGSE
jgi:TusA-related sulfurtransferase